MGAGEYVSRIIPLNCIKALIYGHSICIANSCISLSLSLYLYRLSTKIPTNSIQYPVVEYSFLHPSCALLYTPPPPPMH